MICRVSEAKSELSTVGALIWAVLSWQLPLAETRGSSTWWREKRTCSGCWLMAPTPLTWFCWRARSLPGKNCTCLLQIACREGEIQGQSSHREWQLPLAPLVWSGQGVGCSSQGKVTVNRNYLRDLVSRTLWVRTPRRKEGCSGSHKHRVDEIESWA